MYGRSVCGGRERDAGMRGKGCTLSADEGERKSRKEFSDVMSVSSNDLRPFSLCNQATLARYAGSVC